MEKHNITNKEIQNQSIFSTDEWLVLLPKNPISPYHFMLIPKRKDVSQFTKLNEDELIGLKNLVSYLVEKIETSGVVVDGYNLFSNNGTYEIGQRLSCFHQHIFVRVQGELVSPYTVMAEGRYWAKFGSDEWNKRISELKAQFSLL